MKTITLHRLVLRNFKGFTFDLDISGDDADISGRNATGKTTLADAFAWLLFDKDSLGRSDFEIKNLDAQGQEEHGLEHSVEGFLNIDGDVVVLKKVYKEIWTKKRGSIQVTFTGHTTDYFINGVPVQKKDYVAQVTDLAGDESAFKLLTSPATFPSLPWQKQRGLLLEVCGDLTDNQVIEADSKLSSLLEILGKRSIDDHRKVITARRTEINKALEALPIRIDEVRRGLPDVTGLDQKAIIKNVGVLETALNDAKLRLQGIDTGGNIAELSKKLTIVNADIQKIEQVHYNDTMKTVNRLNLQIMEITEKAQSEERQVKNIKDEIRQKADKIIALEKELATLREKWGAIDAETFQDTTEDICASCGQSLPSERVQEAREKALANFNRSKAERLTKIEIEGKSFASSVKLAKEDIESLNVSLKERPATGAENLEALKSERDSVKKTAEDYSMAPGRSDLIIKREEIEVAIKDAKESVAWDHDKIMGEVSALQGSVNEAKADADKFVRIKQGTARVEELKAEEKKLAAEFERLEQELYLTELFIKTKVSMLTSRINEGFEIVRFKLFETQVNQGISECCELTINGIPYSGGLNSSARTQGGLDIIRTLQHHYGLLCPIWIDNRESVTEIPKMDCQIISLIVSPNDATLRVETVDKGKEYANTR